MLESDSEAIRRSTAAPRVAAKNTARLKSARNLLNEPLLNAISELLIVTIFA